jgi:hypothetical protein
MTIPSISLNAMRHKDDNYGFPKYYRHCMILISLSAMQIKQQASMILAGHHDGTDYHNYYQGQNCMNCMSSHQ